MRSRPKHVHQPATRQNPMKLAQWAGRGVRTETDWAVITLCDNRLTTMRYGQAILAGLSPFPVVLTVAAV